MICLRIDVELGALVNPTPGPRKRITLTLDILKPAILAHPALQIGMAANWWGLQGEALNKLVGKISKTNEVISGIPGSGVDQDGVPYSLTEEFVSVYRMHPLIPGKQHEVVVPAIG